MDKKILDDLRKQFGADVAFRLNEPGRVPDVKLLPTGIATLDNALGGGIAQGRITEIYGPESAGKSAMACAIVGSLQDQGYGAIFIDMEHGFNPRHALSNGMSLDTLIVSQPKDARMAMSVIEQIVRRSENPMVVVLDSVAALVTPSELEADPGSAVIGETARLMSQMMRKLAGPTDTGNHVLIFINQLRMKIGVMFGNPETTTGGRALRFYASQRIQLFARRKITENKEDIGITTRVRIDKNKVAPPFRTAEFDIWFDDQPYPGIDKVASVLDVACEKEIVRKAGGSHYYPYDEEKRFAGSRAEAVTHLRENSDVYSEIYATVTHTLKPPTIEI